MHCTFKLGLTLALMLTFSSAHAVPFLFRNLSTFTSVDGLLAGVASVGDTITADVIMDNGGSSTLSQTWAIADTVSAHLTVGGYSATYLDAFCCGAGFATDGLGDLVTANWLGTLNTLGASFDSFSVGGSVRLFSNAIRASDDLLSFYTPNLGTFDSWSGPRAVPEPATLALMGLGLAGLGYRKRKAA